MSGGRYPCLCIFLTWCLYPNWCCIIYLAIFICVNYETYLFSMVTCLAPFYLIFYLYIVNTQFHKVHSITFWDHKALWSNRFSSFWKKRDLFQRFRGEINFFLSQNTQKDILKHQHGSLWQIIFLHDKIKSVAKMTISNIQIIHRTVRTIKSESCPVTCTVKSLNQYPKGFKTARLDRRLVILLGKVRYCLVMYNIEDIFFNIAKYLINIEEG